jgi:hypothetical protein
MAVSSEADEKNSILEWPNGVAQRSDQGGPRYPLGEQGRRTPGRVPNEGWTGTRRGWTGARRRARRVPDRGREGCPTEARSRGVAQQQVSGVARRGSI